MGHQPLRQADAIGLISFEGEAHGQAHGLFLEERHAEGLAEHAFQFIQGLETLPGLR